MHDEAFADATRPTPAVVLGITLRDYALGHELLLWKSRNPLLCLREESFNDLPALNQRNALLWAVEFCHQTWADNRRGHRNMRFWAWTNRKANWPLEIAEFRNYLSAGRTGPPTFAADNPSDTPQRDLGAPFISLLTLFIARELHIPWRDVFDFPMGLAQFLYFSDAENKGAVNILNWREAAFERHCAEEDAKEAAAQPKEATCPP